MEHDESSIQSGAITDGSRGHKFASLSVCQRVTRTSFDTSRLRHQSRLMSKRVFGTITYVSDSGAKVRIEILGSKYILCKRKNQIKQQEPARIACEPANTATNQSDFQYHTSINHCHTPLLLTCRGVDWKHVTIQYLKTDLVLFLDRNYHQLFLLIYKTTAGIRNMALHSMAGPQDHRFATEQ
ncbi:hypothetical protein NXS19_005667 [Fusarium pseudograminearum]|nr:hypothetical protein NXS19_005667 [Fusarium pseudograminearum]